MCVRAVRFCATMLPFLTLHTYCHAGNLAGAQTLPAASAHDCGDIESRAQAQPVPALNLEELIAFCAKSEQEEQRETAINAVQNLFESLRGEQVTHRTTQNLLLNSDFEEWNAERPRCWVCSADDNSAITPDLAGAKSGERSLRIDLREGAGKATIEQTVVVPRPCAVLNLSGYTRRTGSVTFEASLCAVKPDGTWRDLFRNESQLIEKQLSKAHEWMRDSINIPRMIPTRAPDRQRYERLKVSFLVRGRGTLWIDDVSLKPITEREAIREAQQALEQRLAKSGGFPAVISGAPLRYWFPSGHVFDALSNQPLEGATVFGAQLLPLGNTNSYVTEGGVTISTDRSGFFEMVEPVTQQALSVHANGYEDRAIAFGEGGEKNLTILLQPRTSVAQSKHIVRGESSVYGLVSLDNVPYTGLLQIAMYRAGGSNVDGYNLQSEDGQYRIGGLPGGSYRLWIRTAQGPSAHTEVTLRDQESKKLDLLLDSETHKSVKIWIAGYVRDSRTGKPVEGAAVRYEQNGAFTNSRGFFLLPQKVEPRGPALFLDVTKTGYKKGYGLIDAARTEAQDGRVTVNVTLERE